MSAYLVRILNPPISSWYGSNSPNVGSILALGYSCTTLRVSIIEAISSIIGSTSYIIKSTSYIIGETSVIIEVVSSIAGAGAVSSITFSLTPSLVSSISEVIAT